MKSCPFCKNNIEDNALYCPHCGNDVTVGDTFDDCYYVIVYYSAVLEAYEIEKNKIGFVDILKTIIYTILAGVIAYYSVIFIAMLFSSPKQKLPDTTVQMPIGNKPDSILKKDSVSDNTIKIDSTKMERIYAKANEEKQKRRELVFVNGKDSLYAELLDADFHSYKLYLASTDGGFYLDKLPDADFEYVTQYAVIGDNVHFVAGKDGYGKGMTNYYFVFNTTIWSLKKIAEGHLIKFLDGQAEVTDFDGNKTYHDLI